ncbi:MAG: DUF1573 domain-containing protein [Flavobacteriales bacterium]|nr:DUF1573 domain-containing protein [Flavobacteriales bacterium]MCB9447674.1 DUF1573 domain-containing protein [Flavobacteriales bacterium]
MRNYLNFLAAATFLTLMSCGGDQQEQATEDLSPGLVENPASADGGDPADLPTMEFDEPSYGFGTITQGEKVAHSYTFKNNGKADLIISNATGSCGCTVPKWPDQPIAPGETGTIDVVFDSDGKSGRQEKTVTILANTQPNRTTLKLYGEVAAPGSEATE